jgi:chlorobactene glucosyltransferase
MDNILLVISYFIFVYLIILFIVNLINLFATRKIYIIKNPEYRQPFVSILIPARNEAENIMNCINSCIQQDYPDFEIIVLDDNSEDRTYDIASSVIHPKLRVIRGKPLERDWVGKSFACYQLKEEAKGEFLLFLDADTNLKPGALKSSVNFAIEHNTGLLSLMPDEIALTFWEKVAIPLMHFTVWTMLPLILVEKTRKTSLTMSNGQFMLFNRKVYEDIGGHESVKKNMVDDVWLGRKVKISGNKLIFADGSDVASCRMYKNFNEIVKGFSKNLFPGLSFSVILLIFVIITYFSLYILPLFILIYGLIAMNEKLVLFSVINISIPIIMRITHSVKYGLPLYTSFLNFISASLVIFFGLNSFRLIKFGKGAQWKDRIYKYNEINK